MHLWNNEVVIIYNRIIIIIENEWGEERKLETIENKY